MVMMHTTPVCDASLLMYFTTEYAAALSNPVVGSSRKSTAGATRRGRGAGGTDRRRKTYRAHINFCFVGSLRDFELYRLWETSNDRIIIDPRSYRLSQVSVTGICSSTAATFGSKLEGLTPIIHFGVDGNEGGSTSRTQPASRGIDSILPDAGDLPDARPRVSSRGWSLASKTQEDFYEKLPGTLPSDAPYQRSSRCLC